MRMMQKSNDWNMADKNYWQENGWLGKKDLGNLEVSILERYLYVEL